MTNATPAPTGGAIASMQGVTATTLVLIAIGAVVVVLLMIWGARKKRERKAADRELRAQASSTAPTGTITDEDAEPVRADASPSAPQPSVPAAPPPIVASPRAAEQASKAPDGDAEAPASAPVVHDAPVAPAPPPLAGDDTPVVAAAPFDASPASVAADLATPPSDAQSSAADYDDLTVMKGVGPRLAVRLGELGVTRYADLAELTPEQADALDAQLGSFRGRLTRDRWIEQAGYLARGDRAGFEAAFGKL